MTSPPVRAQRRSPRGEALGVVAWSGLALSLAAIAFLLFMLFGYSVGAALGGSFPESQRAAFAAGFGIVAAVLLGIVVVAAVGSRWVAFTLALAALLFSAYLGVGLASGLHSARPPAEKVDPSPVPCQCYSGSVCECPGG